MTDYETGYSICGACGYDMRQQWDHGIDDRCVGCVEKGRKERESQQALIFYVCNHCGRPYRECECPFDHGY